MLSLALVSRYAPHKHCSCSLCSVDRTLIYDTEHPVSPSLQGPFADDSLHTHEITVHMATVALISGILAGHPGVWTYLV